MSSFACVATWKFGATRTEFTTFGTSIRTEFSMLFGESNGPACPRTVNAPGVAFLIPAFTRLRRKRRMSECVA